MVISRTATFLFFLFALATHAQTYISGDVTGTWKTDGNPYVVTDNIVINTNDRLKIEPGVIVQFEANCSIMVYGNLEANGTESDSIRFTTSDTTGFSTGNYNGWYGIGFLGQGVSQSEPSILNYCTIEYSKGSGITCMQYDALEINHSHFRNNKLFGINLMEYSDINMEYVKISNNGAGGMDVQYSAPQIQHFEIFGNEGTGISFEGITMFNTPSSMSHGIIHDNISSGNGGGISLKMEAGLLLTDVELTSNMAMNGGGIYCAFSSLDASRMNISENIAESGAGIYACYDAQIEIDHTLLIDNNASQSGGAVYVLDSEFDMLLSTISNNRAAISGGGFFFDLINNTPNHLSNCIVWQNYPDEILASANVPELDFCDVRGGFAGTFILDSDPLFVDAGMNNYELSWDQYPVNNSSKSPCIDAGNPHLNYDPDETISDMGAFYYDQTATVTEVASSTVVDKFNLYPNPVTSSFFIQGTDEIENVQVCNLSGQLVKNFHNVNAQSSYDVSDLQTGIYVVRIIRSNGSIESNKIIRK